MTDINRAFTLLSGKLTRWLQQFILLLPNLLIAVLILVVTFFAARLVRRLMGQVLPRVSTHATLNNLVSTLAYLGVLLVGTFFTLEVLSLDKTVTSLLAGVGIIGLALGFAFQDMAANFISGIIIAVQRPFTVGDVIQTDAFFGTIERINLRTLDLRQVTGELVRVPNRKVFESAVINYTVTTRRRVDLDCGVAYDSDLEQVRAVALQAMRDFPKLLTDRPPEVMFTGFGDSAITFTLRFWIPYQQQVDYVGAKSEAVMRIKRAFDEAGIVIPFPIRTLDVSPALLAQLRPTAAE
ncbi:small conductance mechanosensitive channel [Hymenobacter luteus]|uniref:Small conductance mechanosensitive channel n=2 Tax=Hymenobacter TaxID=89966 RepID=A0A7W9T641_9BACT|nr:MULTISPECIES: mechanosensitive ion channel [Hymenobacter]MBB4603722.1 small conductance mechanosensitive channel [Hymenobacter latericoloratus]MBB6061503.1 small conductance mechanosensitive channel [Hymenobacter luteus]